MELKNPEYLADILPVFKKHFPAVTLRLEENLIVTNSRFREEAEPSLEKKK